MSAEESSSMTETVEPEAAETPEVAETTPEVRDEIVKIRARQRSLVVQVRDRDKDGVNWTEVDREVDAVVVDLNRDIERVRVKVVK